MMQIYLRIFYFLLIISTGAMPVVGHGSERSSSDDENVVPSPSKRVKVGGGNSDFLEGHNHESGFGERLPTDLQRTPPREVNAHAAAWVSPQTPGDQALLGQRLPAPLSAVARASSDVSVAPLPWTRPLILAGPPRETSSGSSIQTPLPATPGASGELGPVERGGGIPAHFPVHFLVSGSGSDHGLPATPCLVAPVEPLEVPTPGAVTVSTDPAEAGPVGRPTGIFRPDPSETLGTEEGAASVTAVASTEPQ